MAAPKVLGELGVLWPEAAEVHDAREASVVSGFAEVGGALAVDLGEFLPFAHRMDEVEGGVTPGRRLLHRFRIQHVRLDDLDGIPPRAVVELARTARHTSDLVPGFEKLRYEPSSDVSGGAGDEDFHPGSVGAHLRLADSAFRSERRVPMLQG